MLRTLMRYGNVVLQQTRMRRIGPINLTASSAADAVATMIAAVDAGCARMFSFCNAHTVNLARRDPKLVAALGRATVFNDGLGVDIAGRLLHGRKFPANLNGTDLTPMFLEALSHSRRRRIFLLGSAPGVAAKAAVRMAEAYPGLELVGVQHGFFKPSEAAGVLDMVEQSRPDVVLVGMGQPQQELWAAGAMDRLNTVVVCIGAFMDFCAGTVPRAPMFIRRVRLEWLYRLMIEPRRMANRYMVGNVRFLVDVAIERIKSRSS